MRTTTLSITGANTPVITRSAPEIMKAWGKQSLLSSGALSFVQALWSVALGLVTTPILLHGLGVEAYGVYALAFTIAGLGSYLDFGLGWTTSKFIAEADALNDAPLLASTVRAAAIYNSAVGAVAVTVLVPAAPFIARALHFSPSQELQIAATLRIAAVSFLFASVGGVFISSLRGTRRFAAASAISIVGLTVSVTGAAFASRQGLGVVSAALFQMFGTLLGALLGAAAFRGQLRAEWGPIGLRTRLRQMLGFSIWSYANRLTQMFMYEADKLLVGRFAGPGALTFYAVPFGIGQRVAFIGGPAVNAMYPAAAAGQFDRDRFIHQYFRGSRLVHVLTAAVALTVFWWAERLLLVWLGPEMAHAGGFFLRVF